MKTSNYQICEPECLCLSCEEKRKNMSLSPTVNAQSEKIKELCQNISLLESRVEAREQKILQLEERIKGFEVLEDQRSRSAYDKRRLTQNIIFSIFAGLIFGFAGLAFLGVFDPSEETEKQIQCSHSDEYQLSISFPKPHQIKTPNYWTDGIWYTVYKGGRSVNYHKSVVKKIEEVPGSCEKCLPKKDKKVY